MLINDTTVKTSIARRNKLSSLMKTNEVVIGTLGLGISTLQLMQSLRSLANNMNQNDEHVIRADLANLINASATTCLVWTGCPNDFISFSLKHIRSFIKNLRFNSIPFYDSVKWCFHF